MVAEVCKRRSDDAEVADFLAGQDTYLFQEPVWGEVLASLGFSLAYYCLEDEGRIVLAHQMARVRVGFFDLLCGGLPYGFAVGDMSRHEEFVRLLVEAVRAEGVHRIRLSRNYYDPPLEPEGYRVREHVLHILNFDGRTEDQVWKDFKSRVRRDVRLAERRGVAIESADSPEARDELFHMYCDTMARNRTIVTWRRAMIEKMWDLLVSRGRGEMLLARYEGEPVAGIVTLYSARRCFYFLGASSGAHRSLCPNDAVVWEAMHRALARGCEVFDLMTSSRDDVPLMEFKAKWGATQHPFYFYEKDLSPMRCRLFDLACWAVRTRVGGALLRLVKGRGG
ncbi:MAG TPA: GNAT family N-acetyltransferase [Phycisphaerae bacterium]|nr:GNAT family N-acetyltransferase [Phycisphaerae bacterium]